MAGPVNHSTHARLHAKKMPALGLFNESLKTSRKWVLSFAIHWQPSFLSGEPTRPHISRDTGPGEQDNWHLWRLAIGIASFGEASPCGICLRLRRTRGRNGTE